MERKKTIVRFIILVFVFYAAMGTFTPYLIPMGISRGYSQTAVTMIISVQMIFILLGNTLWGRMADRLQKNKMPFMLSLLLNGCVQALLFLVRQQTLYFTVFALFGLCCGTSGVLLDAWVLNEISFDISRFRKIRSAGAAGYAVTVLISGWIVENLGYGRSLILSLSLIVLTVLLSLSVRESEKEIVHQTTSEKSKGLGFLKQPVYLAWVFLLVLSGMATNPIGTLKIVILERVGKGTSALGVDSFIGCVAQFFLFFAAAKLEKLKPLSRMFLACTAITVGVLLYMFASSVYIIYIATMLFYGIYSIVNPGTREIIRDYIPPKDQTTAIGIADACGLNISTMIAMLYTGLISERYGIYALMVVCLGMSLLTVVISGALAFKENRAQESHEIRERQYS